MLDVTTDDMIRGIEGENFGRKTETKRARMLTSMELFHTESIPKCHPISAAISSIPVDLPQNGFSRPCELEESYHKSGPRSLKHQLGTQPRLNDKMTMK